MVMSGRPPSPGPASPRILVVDEQPLFGAAISRVLCAPPLNARVTAYQKVPGLAELDPESVDLVLCALRPDPTASCQLARMLGDLPRAVPVVLLGEVEDEDLLVQSLPCGPAGMFTKDVALEEFLNGISAVLDGHQVMGLNLMRRLVRDLARRVSTPVHGDLAPLSPTELGILSMVGEARPIAEIAAARGISTKTVRNHLASIYRKLKLNSRVEAMLLATRLGLVPPPDKDARLRTSAHPSAPPGPGAARPEPLGTSAQDR